MNAIEVMAQLFGQWTKDWPTGARATIERAIAHGKREMRDQCEAIALKLAAACRKRGKARDTVSMIAAELIAKEISKLGAQ